MLPHRKQQPASSRTSPLVVPGCFLTRTCLLISTVQKMPFWG
jgi:hypothetical protein